MRSMTALAVFLLGLACGGPPEKHEHEPQGLKGKAQTPRKASVEPATCTPPHLEVSLARQVGDELVEYVKGQQGARALTVALKATDTTTISEFPVRFYASASNEWSTSVGDQPANTVVANARIVSGIGLLGLAPLSLVDVDGDGIYTPDYDYYVAVFHPWLQIPAGTTLIEVRVNLLNNFMVDRWLAPDINPADIVAVDGNGNPVTPAGGPLNSELPHVPLVKTLESGTLQITAPLSQPDGDVPAGSTRVIVARYGVKADRESFSIQRLTVVNVAAENVFLVENAKDTPALAQVTMRYTDDRYVAQEQSASLLNGIAYFSGLNLPVSSEQGWLEILVDINEGDWARGEHVRLGLVEKYNTSTTFQAIGMFSSVGLSDPQILGPENIKGVTVY